MSGGPVDQAAVDGLLRERAGYVQRGLVNRVAQVDAQLKVLGYKADTGSDSASSDPVEEAGGATARRQSGRRTG